MDELHKMVAALNQNLSEVNVILSKVHERLQEYKAVHQLTQKEVLTVDEASELTGISSDSINYYVQNNLIPHKKIGKHTRFSKSYLLRWIEEDMDMVMKKFRHNKK